MLRGYPLTLAVPASLWLACAKPDSHAGSKDETGTTDRETMGGGDGSVVHDSDSVTPTPSCSAVADDPAPVSAPLFVRNLAGNTGWYSSPGLVDLDGDGTLEIIAPSYDVFLYDHEGALIGQQAGDQYHFGRIYAPAVVADLDGDGIVEVVAGGSRGSVAAYEASLRGLSIKAGWPVTACNSADCENVEVRGMAAADLDRNGTVEIVVTTTETDPAGAQVFVFEPDGRIYDRTDTTWPDWPRYNTLSGQGGDADANGIGHQGYGCYGLNIGIGNLDRDDDLEIVVTYDNHQINVFDADGRSFTASSYFSNRQSDFADLPLDWGQFIRYRDPEVEEAHYHLHDGDWPSPSTHPWLQWTASPPVAADLDGDGRREVIGVPNVEENEPYETVAYAVMVLQGDYGDDRSARRLPGWERLPQSGAPWPRGDGDWYPPIGVPAPSVANILGDERPEIIVSMNDGYMYAWGPDAEPMWRYDYAHGVAKTYASEPVLADLNRDGRPEVVFSTYALHSNAGRLVVLGNDGTLLHDTELPNQGDNGNGIGGAAAPSIGDLDGDGTLEIVVMSFDHGVDVFTVPDSADNCLLWPTGRANLLRNGQGPA